VKVDNILALRNEVGISQSRKGPKMADISGSLLGKARARVLN
jgi:hypothetical protein